MDPKKPRTVQELIDQLMNWNRKFKKELFTTEQIKAEQEKQWNWLHNIEVKQKEFIELETQRCEPYERSRHFYFMGTGFALPQLLYMSFLLTNDHIERIECDYKKARFDFTKIPLN